MPWRRFAKLIQLMIYAILRRHPRNYCNTQKNNNLALIENFELYDFYFSYSTFTDL